jgi:glycosyltransferase involved in cell wall biosynthesis
MAKRIRVIQLLLGITPGEFNGGAEVYAMQIAERLDQREFEPIVVCLWGHQTATERQYRQRLAAHTIPTYFGAPWRIELRRDILGAFLACYPIIKRLQPAIVHSHVEFADFVGLWIKLLGGCQHLLRTSHNTREWSYAPHINPWMRLSQPLICDREVAISPGVQSILNQRPLARLLQRNAPYVPNGIDPAQVHAQHSAASVRAALGIRADAPLFTMVGRLSQQKGVPYLLEAMVAVRQRLPAAQLLIAGDGEDRAATADLIEQLGLRGHVHLLGARRDAYDLIHAADLFVLPSLWEGLPTVLMEAMCLGTPILATDIPGSADLIEHGVTGWLVPAADASALAAGMLRQYHNYQQAQAMAQVARQAVERYSYQQIVGEYAAIYRELGYNMQHSAQMTEKY